MRPDASQTASICNNAAIRRATRRLGQLYDHALAPSGLKATQFAILVEIRDLEGPTIRSLADNLVMDISALGHTLKPLVREGLVVLNPDPFDRRAKRAALTPLGETRLDEALALWSQAHGRFETLVGPDRAAELRRTLDWIASPDFAERFETP